MPLDGMNAEALVAHYAGVKCRLGLSAKSRPVTIPERPKEPKEAAPIRINPMQFYKLAFANSIAKASDAKSSVARPSFKSVLEQVAIEVGMPPEVILAKRRKKAIVLARRYFLWRVARECPHLSISDIGRRAGQDHTTVLYAIHKYSVEIGEKPDLNPKGMGRPNLIGSGRIAPGFVRHRP